MGTPMARNIMKGGFALTVWNRTGAKAEPLLSAGATWAEGIGELAERSDVVFTMVTDATPWGAVMCGKDRTPEGPNPGPVIVDTSSTAPVPPRRNAARARD